MITKLKLHNFKTFLNAEVDFQRRHLLIGKNNSGKTNLASALRFLGATTTVDLSKAANLLIPGGIAEMANWALDSNVIELSCTCMLEFDGKPCRFTYDLKLAATTDPHSSASGQIGLRVVDERLVAESKGFAETALLENNGHEATMLHEEQYVQQKSAHQAKTLAPKGETMLSKLYELDTNRRALLFRRFLAAFNYFSLSPAFMRLGHGRQKFTGGLFTLGDNLADAIFHLKNYDEARYRRVIEHTRLIEPDLEAINFVPVPDQPAIPFIALKSNARASWNGLSDGALRALALAYIIESSSLGTDSVSSVNPLYIIEEPENGIYPGQLRAVFDLFEERAPCSQFLFTSHSPYFINMFDSDRRSVTILKNKGGRTEVLCDPPLDENDSSPDRLMLAEQYSMDLIE